MQWKPFETQYGKVSSSFRYHLGILNHSVQALQYNAIQDGNRAAEIERSGTIFQFLSSLEGCHSSFCKQQRKREKALCIGYAQSILKKNISRLLGKDIKIQVIGSCGNLNSDSGLMTSILVSSGVMENVNTLS